MTIETPSKIRHETSRTTPTASSSTSALSFEHRRCPLCATELSEDTQPAIQSHPTAEALDFEQLKSMWYGFFKEKSFFSYYRCPKCQTLFNKNYFTPAQLDQLYGKMPDNTAGIPVSALKKTQESYFNELESYSPLTGNYLEVGPDIGLFTECSVRKGNFSKYWLFEPNASVQPALEKLLSGKTYQILPEFLQIEKLPDQDLSVVVMVHVLDHLTDPKSLLLQLKKKLAPGAVLLFVTHNESSILAKVIKSKWPPYCLQHPLLFNPQSITSLLSSTGYKVMSIINAFNYFPIGYLAQHGLWSLGIKGIPIPKMNRLVAPLKLGNIVTIAKLE